MLQLDILSGTQAGTQSVARRFPFTVGRGQGDSLKLSDPGVWEQHLTIELVRAEKAFRVRCHETANLTINGDSVTEAALRNGDLLQIGGAKIRVGITAPIQKGMAVREAAVWFFLAAVSVAQLGIIYLLTR